MTSDLYLFDRLDIPSSNPVLQEIYVLNSKTSECYLKRKKKRLGEKLEREYEELKGVNLCVLVPVCD